MKFKELILSSLLFFIFTSSAIAGGGRMLLYSNSTTIWHTKSAPITAQVFVDGNWSSYSVGEKLEFRIKNPQAGDHCFTEQSVSSNLGVVYGTCYTDSKREMEVYLYSLDKGDQSSVFLLHFIDPPQPSPPPSPISSPTPTSTSNPSPSFTAIPEPTPQPSLKVTPTAKPEISLEPSFKAEPEPVETTEAEEAEERDKIPLLPAFEEILGVITNFWKKVSGFLGIKR